MKFKKLLILILFSLFSYSCAEYSVNTNKKGVERKYFASSGFALIYKDELYNNKTINKKIDNNEIVAIHSILKRNTKIKIFNPSNSKIVETVVTKKANYPGIFNVLISERIANILDLDRNNPFVEIIEVKKNKTFVAKKSNTYDEEKNVAEKAPVDEIKMDDLSSAEKNEKVIPFSMTKIWDHAIKNKILYGFESKEHFVHLTDLEIYNKLVKNN